MCGHRGERNAHDIWEFVRRKVKECEEDVWSFYIPEEDIREHVVEMLEVFNYKVINSKSKKTVYIEV